MAIYDLIIIGTGPAGYTAAIYAARYRMKTLVIGKELGGLITLAHSVENYPGFPQISGLELMKKFKEHVEHYNIPIKPEVVNKIAKKNNLFKVSTTKETYASKTILLAVGTERRRLNIPGEKEFLGKGIGYCATCDAPFYKDKIVAVVGGGDAATTAALLLSQYCPKVYLIYRGEALKSEPIWVERVKKNSKITLVLKTNIIEAKGDRVLKTVVLNHPLNKSTELDVSGLFIEIGSVPASALAAQLGVELTDRNDIAINNLCATNIPGIFSAGDIASKKDDHHQNLRQVVTATAEGAIAATSAYQYLQG